MVQMSDKRLVPNVYKDYGSLTQEERLIQAYREGEEAGKQLSNGLLDEEYRTSTQGERNADFGFAENKSSNKLLSSPVLINDRVKNLIRKPIECAKYAVWHKTELYYVPLPCKKWGCPICTKKLARQLELRLANSEASKWPIKRHIILTVAEDAVLSNLSELINGLMTDLRRLKITGFQGEKLIRYPNLRYLWVKEFQIERFKKGGIWWRHIHMLVNVELSKFDIIPYWNKQNHNKFNMIEVRNVRSFNKGSYLTKYFTKEQYQSMFDKGERRYGSSKNVLPSVLRKESSGDWEFMKLAEARNLYDAYLIDPDTSIDWGG